MKYIIPIVLGISACTAQEKSELNQVKIQTAEQGSALVIRATGISPGNSLVERAAPNLDCNKPDAIGYLSSDFTPSMTVPGADPNCPVYGYTRNGFPFWKVKSEAPGAILLDSKRIGGSSNYPLGVQFSASTSSTMTVNICTKWQVAETTDSEASCLNEGKDFFEAETAGLSPAKKEELVGKAIVEALLLLSYSDAGLGQCYETALLKTEKVEDSWVSPFDEGFNLFRSLRRRNENFPLTSDELAYFSEVISQLSESDLQAYHERYLLAKRLDYQIDSDLQQEKTFAAYEPAGLESWDDYNREAAGAMNAQLGPEAADLAKIRTEDLFFELGQFLDQNQKAHIILARGYVGDLKQQTDNSLVASGNLSKAKLRLWGDMVYRAVLLAKATRLQPLAAFEKLKKEKKLGESCSHYARYRPGLPNPRENLVKAFPVSTTPDVSSALVVGEFGGNILDAKGEVYKPGTQLTGMYNSYSCKTDGNAEGFCPVTWLFKGPSADRYSAFKVSVSNKFNVSSPLWEKTLELANGLQNVTLISGQDMVTLVNKGFFKFASIAPVIQIEGVLKGGTGRTELVFSSKLDRAQGEAIPPITVRVVQSVDGMPLRPEKDWNLWLVMSDSDKAQVKCVTYTLQSPVRTSKVEYCNGEPQKSAQSYLISGSDSASYPIEIKIVLQSGQSITLRHNLVFSWKTWYKYGNSESECQKAGLKRIEGYEDLTYSPVARAPQKFFVCATESRQQYDAIVVDGQAYDMGYGMTAASL